MRVKRTIIQYVALFALVIMSTACAQSLPSQSLSRSPHLSSSKSESMGPNLQTLQRRSLHLPSIAAGATCPTTPLKKVSPAFGIAQGEGPAYATIGQAQAEDRAVLHYVDAKHFGNGASENERWGGQKVLWFVDPRYRGLVLVRGHQIDGEHEMRFSQTLDSQLVIDTASGGTPWPNQASYTRLQSPGCYAYQVDGFGFSYAIVFQASLEENA